MPEIFGLACGCSTQQAMQMVPVDLTGVYFFFDRQGSITCLLSIMAGVLAATG
jgi:hypothetical protein